MTNESITFNLPLPDYLRQWLINAMGGQVPVKFPKGSAFSSFLRIFIRHKRERESWIPKGPDTVSVVVPKFPGKDPCYYNFLPAAAQKDLQGLIRDAFDSRLLSEIITIGNVGRRLNDIIATWMEENGIEVNDRNFESVLKRSKILRRRLYDRQRKREEYNRKKSAL